MLIDTHCHLEMIVEKLTQKPFSPDNLQTVNKIVADAAVEAVSTIVTIGTNLGSCNDAFYIASHFENVFCTVGIHPTDQTTLWEDDLKSIETLIKKNSTTKKIVAIGECGLDFYHPGFEITAQKELFRRQIRIAHQNNLPLVIHTRNAFKETIEVLDEHRNLNLHGIIHCFSEDISEAKNAIDRGFLVGIGGAVTYPKNDRLRNVAKVIGLDHLVLETDAPFLAPQEFRGKTNFPAYISSIAHYLATYLNIPFEEVAHKTTRNARVVFQIAKH